MVESVSYVPLRDLSPINPMKAIEIVRPSSDAERFMSRTQCK